MPYELFLALRYLRSRRRPRLARVTAVVAVSGISIGVAALIVAVALANGFRDEMREKILRGTSHLSVIRREGEPITDYVNLVEKIRRIKGVASASGTTYDGALLVGPRGPSYAVLRGVDSQSAQEGLNISRSLVSGTAESIFRAQSDAQPEAQNIPDVVLGAELAARTELHAGDLAEIIPANTNPTFSGPIKQTVRVIGVFRSGLFEYDSTWIYLSLDAAAVIAGTRHSASVISVQLTDIYSARQVAANLQSALGTAYTTVDWQEANRPLFTALALERRMALFVIGLIIVIAVLNITTTLILVVVERNRDIAIITTMGAESRSVTAIFMLEGAIIGAIGTLIGIGSGCLVCFLGNHYKVISLPSDVYSISHVPFHAHALDILGAAVVAFLLAVVATIYPARAAARVRPVEMLRNAG